MFAETHAFLRAARVEWRAIAREVVPVVLCAAGLSFTASAHAAPLDQWGTYVAVSTAYCEAAASGCVDEIVGSSTGGVGATSALTSYADARGEGRAGAVLDDVATLPVPFLRAVAAASLADGAGTQGYAYAVEGYRNLGTQRESFTIELDLHAVLDDPTFEDEDTRARGVAAVFAADDGFVFDPESGAMLRGSPSLRAGRTLELIGSLEAEIGDAMTVELDPGEAMYLALSLTAHAARDGSRADAGNSFFASIAGNVGVLGVASIGTSDPPRASVTAPSMGALALLCVAVCAAGRRRIDLRETTHA